MLNFFYRITRSSVDPQKTSLAVKGMLVGVVPVVVLVSGIDVTQVQSVSNAIVDATFAVTTAYASVATLLGLVRKVYNARWNHPDSGTL